MSEFVAINPAQTGVVTSVEAGMSVETGLTLARLRLSNGQEHNLLLPPAMAVALAQKLCQSLEAIAGHKMH